MGSSLNSPKWRLLITILPFTLLFGLAKLASHNLGWEPWAFDSQTGALFGAATFVIAFTLAGTLSGYNESADMPVQIANSVETMQDTNLVLAQVNPEYDPAPLQANLANLLEVILDWLRNDKTADPIEVAISQLNANFAILLPLAGPAMLNRMQGEQAKIRFLVKQMGLSRDTDFIGPAYVLLEVFLVGAISALLLIGTDRFSETLVVSCLMFTSFTYLLLLIRDLDNPFEYNGKSSVDVDLGLLEVTRDRLRNTP